MIYFILNTDANVVKIGYTRKNIEQRLSNLQVGNHAELKLIAVIEGSSKHEKYYHRLFAEHHTKGEWFTYGETLKEFVENLDKTKNIADIKDYEDQPERVAFINLDNNKIANFYFSSEWQLKLKPSSFHMLFPLLILENQRTGEIVLNKKNRNKICKILNCSDAQVSKCLVDLLKNDVIVRAQRGIYLVNPLKMCVGKKTAQQNKLDKYMKYANLKHYQSA